MTLDVASNFQAFNHSQSMSAFGRPQRPKERPKIAPLDRKMKPNPKYANIKPSIDTGFNTRKQTERLEELRHLYKFRPDEIFRRVNVTTLVTLMIEVAKLEIQESDAVHGDDMASLSGDSAIGDGEEVPELQHLHVSTPSLYWSSGGGLKRFNSSLSVRASSVADLVQGIGELDFPDSVSVAADHESQPCDRPYLLLDVRPEDEFEVERIVGAEYYPSSRLNSINFETRSMLKFKNVEGKIIIVYDNDESLASRCATTLIQRGYDNVFMLSGGLRVAKLKFPNHLVTRGKVSHHQYLGEDDISALESTLNQDLQRVTSRISTTSTRVPTSRSIRSRELSHQELSKTELTSRYLKSHQGLQCESSRNGSNLRRQLSASQPSLTRLSASNAAFVRQLRR